MWQECQALMLHCCWCIIQLLISCVDHAPPVSKDNATAACSLAVLNVICVLIQVCNISNISNILPATKADSCTATADAAAATAQALLLLLLLSFST
jgi:hypothetical protein